MKVVAVVPMKLNNERLPGKNTKCFTGGQPLCHYILSTLLTVEGIDEVYVYCSNEEIKNYIPSGVKYLKRSETLDQSTTKINEVLTSFANEVEADVYVLSHATAPFVSKESFEKAIVKIKEEDYDSALTVNKVQEFLWKDGKPFNYDLDNIPRTQDLPPLYSETSGFYMFKRNIILEHNRRIGFNPYLLEISKIESVDIDEPEDFEIADAIFVKKMEEK